MAKLSMNILSAWGSSALRGGAGLRTQPTLGPRPAKRLELYEFEGCPFCRKVRELLTALDLEAVIYPCPKNGTRFRPKVTELGGKAQFPYLVDPNTGAAMYESDAIIAYLVEHYGAAGVPASLKLGPVTTISSLMASAVRGRSAARESRAPSLPLELYSFEASPYCRIAREALCDLELPYVLHNVGKKSPSRPAFIARSGKMQVPWLHDPNTDTSMFESADIVAYLNRTYGR